jgi:hypothetical protein
VGSALDREYGVDDYDDSARSADVAFSSEGAMETPVAVSYGPVPGSV